MSITIEPTKNKTIRTEVALSIVLRLQRHFPGHSPVPLETFKQIIVQEGSWNKPMSSKMAAIKVQPEACLALEVTLHNQVTGRRCYICPKCLDREVSALLESGVVADLTRLGNGRANKSRVKMGARRIDGILVVRRHLIFSPGHCLAQDDPTGMRRDRQS
jgi:hypothetical protein